MPLAVIGGLITVVAIGFGGYRALGPSAPSAAPAPAPAALAPTPAAAPAPAPTAAPAPAPAVATFDAAAEFERIVRAGQPGFGVRAEAPQLRLVIGKDEFKFSLTSDRDGFVYVLGLGPDGTLAQLVPNELSGPAVRIRKGQTWRFPTGDRFFLATQEPPGATQMLLIVSARQRDFDGLKMERAGEIRLFPGKDVLEPIARAHAGPGSALAGKAVCPGSAPCDDEYGAAVLRFDTVRN